MLCAGKLINCDFGSTHGYRTTRTPGRERSRENSREKERKDRSAQERTRENNNTTSTNNTVDVSEIDNGQYFMKITTSKGQVVQKFIKH